MSRLLAILAVIVAFTTFNVARAADDDLTSEFQQVIESQINAFKVDDGVAAYGYAAPSIQKIFPTAEIFMGMVRQGYPQVYRPRSYRFLDTVTDAAGRPAQKVLIISAEGKPYIALYSMEKQPDGTWKIAGCAILQAATDA